MKKINIKNTIALIAVTVLLTGCGNTVSSGQSADPSEKTEVSTAEIEVSETETEGDQVDPSIDTEIEETPAGSIIESEPEETLTDPIDEEEISTSAEIAAEEYATAPEITEDDVKEKLRQYTYAVVPSGIEVCFHGHVAKFLDMDCSALIAYAEENSMDPSEMITVEDFNFDGYVDLFVPETPGAPNMTGKYFRYDTENGYVSWEQLNAVGSFMNVDPELHRLDETISTSLFEWEMREYGWDNDSVYIARREVQYRNDEGELILEEYEGNQLVNRKKLITGESEKDVLGFEELPID